MRLLRLTTREPIATFESNYNTDIVLPPKSKIALQTASIDTIPLIVSISSTNNQLTYQINSAYSKTIDLFQRNYASTQILELLLDIENSLNDSVVFDYGITTTQKPLGLEWNVSLTDKEVTIKYKIGRASSYLQTDSNWDFLSASAGSLGGIDNFSLGGDATSTALFNHSAFFEYALCRGNGYFRCRTRKLEYDAGNAENGYVVGILSNADKAVGTTLADITYGVKFSVDAGSNRTMNLIIDGVIDATTYPIGDYTVDSVDNEYIEFYINGNLIEINNYYDNPVNKQTLFSTGYDGGDYFPIACFFGTRATAEIDAVRITPSPFGKRQPTFLNSSQEVGLRAPPRQPNPNNQDQNFISFSGDLANYLGFVNTRIPTSGFKLGYTVSYSATNNYFIPEEADAILVQLMNLQIESYDSFSTSSTPSGGQRSNILAVIPTTVGGKIIFSPNYPTFLDLNNEEPILLRNLNIRCLREDYSPILINGMGTIVILIE